MHKKIKNIVFYRYNDENKELKTKTTIFYADGTVETVTYEEGIKACKRVAKERNIRTRNA